jgi:hypothetical protein
VEIDEEGCAGQEHHGEGGDDVTLVVEVQREAPGGVQKSVGWCALPLFRGHMPPREGGGGSFGGGSAPPSAGGVGASPTEVAKPSLAGVEYSADPATGDTIFTPLGRHLRVPLLKPPVNPAALSLAAAAAAFSFGERRGCVSVPFDRYQSCNCCWIHHL